jgi:rod shape-determining protein MreC
MARKKRTYGVMPLPSHGWLHRAGHGLLLALLVVIFIMSRSGNPSVMQLRMQLSDGIAPALSFVAAPFDTLSHLGSTTKNWLLTYQQNSDLRAENAELLKWQTTAKSLQAENESLRALLHVTTLPAGSFVTARIVSEFGSAFSSTALINAGSEDGVEKNQAVISARGLAGRVVSVGAQTAQILLLSDMNSRIPVMNERTREKMILIGKNAGLPILGYASADSDSKPGDRLITSGDGGVFPKNIPVGVIHDTQGSAMTVEPFATIADIEYISVVQ